MPPSQERGCRLGSNTGSSASRRRMPHRSTLFRRRCPASTGRLSAHRTAPAPATAVSASEANMRWLIHRRICDDFTAARGVGWTGARPIPQFRWEPSWEPSVADIRPHRARSCVRSIYLTSYWASVSDIERRRGSSSHGRQPGRGTRSHAEVMNKPAGQLGRSPDEYGQVSGVTQDVSE
jgi:hypothetical protein